MRGSVVFGVEGIPRPKGSKRAFVVHSAGKPRAVMSEQAGSALADWMHATRAAAKAAMGDDPPMDGPVSLLLVFNLPRPRSHFRSSGALKGNAPSFHASRPDADKLARAVKDALIGTVYADDGQVWQLYVAKIYGLPGRAGPGVSVTASCTGFTDPLAQGLVAGHNR